MFVKYPTISKLSQKDFDYYENTTVSKRLGKCEICKISFPKKKYQTCPLCEGKKKIEVINNNIDKLDEILKKAL